MNGAAANKLSVSLFTAYRVRIRTGDQDGCFSTCCLTAFEPVLKLKLCRYVQRCL